MKQIARRLAAQRVDGPREIGERRRRSLSRTGRGGAVRFGDGTAFQDQLAVDLDRAGFAEADRRRRRNGATHTCRNTQHAAGAARPF